MRRAGPRWWSPPPSDQSQPALSMAAASAPGCAPSTLAPEAPTTRRSTSADGVGASAVIGSANLTGGLVTNFEAGVALRGSRDDQPLARAWSWAEELWADDRVEPWTPGAAEEAVEPFDPVLYAGLRAEVRRDPVFTTLGRIPKPNRVIELTPVEVHVETERSRTRAGGGEPIPAWMFNLAWERLRTHGRLSNSELLNDLRVHRSSAVCAMLARLQQIERVPGKEIVLRWR